ncbi:unnamed protein product [Musa hybrid cultivar]
MANAVDTAGSNGDDGAGGGGGGARPPRLPRWTRQEILVLIQGKRVVESRGRGRGAGRGGGGSGEMGAGALVAAASPVEPKWASVSSYCRRHGVDRGPVQCRKRWSNLAGDFKKIKEWEAKGKESFWTMRNDLRRERRLPGFFDREVYDILDGVAVAEVEAEPVAEEEEEGKKGFGRTAAAGGEEEEAVFDSGRTAAEDGLFSDFEEEKEAEDEDEDTAPPPPQPVAAVPISEKKYESSQHWRSDEATAKDKPQAENPGKSSPSRGGQKRRRTSPDEAEDSDLQSRLIEVLERNSRMLTAQLEAQNMNCQLDRDQRKDQANGLLAVLGKLADALGRIADKL